MKRKVPKMNVNLAFRNLRTPQYRKRVEKNPKAYTRKGRGKGKDL